MGGAVQRMGAAAAEGHLAHHQGGDEQHHVGSVEAEAHLLPEQGADEQHRGDRQGDGGQHGPEVEVHGALQLVVEGRLDGADRLRRKHDTGHDETAQRGRGLHHMHPVVDGDGQGLGQQDHHHQVGEQQQGVIDVAA
ncbi:hypothetical protein D3C72_1954270 [compost metagenome]